MNPRLLAGAALLAAALAPAAARAAIWDNSRWAVSAAAETGVGYDDNLFSRAGGAGDGYLRFTPSASLRRLNSLTDLGVKVSVRSFTFLDRSDLNSLDPALDLKLRYPGGDETLAQEEVAVHLGRETESNADVGGRLRRDDFGASWEGSFSPTGKTAILGRTKLGHTDYLTAGYNTNESVSVGTTLAYVANERLQIGAGYDFTGSRSRPENSLRQPTIGREHAFTLRGRGEFLPKVTGYAFVGVSHNDYSGAVDLNRWTLVGSLSLAWKATARGTLTWRAARQNYFSPDGAASTHADLGLEWTQEMKGGFLALAGADAGTVQYDGIRTHSARQAGGHFELRYELTPRFAAGFITTYVVQDSEDALGDYDRTTVYLNSTYKF